MKRALIKWTVWMTLLTAFAIAIFRTANFFWIKSDAAVFWQAIQGISSSIAALGVVLIIFQINSLFEERQERKINGYIFLIENILDEEFKTRLTGLVKISSDTTRRKVSKVVFIDEAMFILNRIEIASIFFKKNYMDADLLFLTIGHELVLSLSVFDSPPQKFRQLVIALAEMYPNAISFINDAEVWSKRNETK